MRTLLATTLATFGLAGCLGAPTGRDPGAVDAPIDGASNPWPPPGADIAAIASGDLDGDGKDDLVALDVADDRIHWLRGGEDINPTRSTVDTSTAAADLPGLDRPAAVSVVHIGAARHVVVLDTPPSGPRVTVFDMQLRQSGTAMIEGVDMPMPDDVVTVSPSTFGQEMNATLLTLPDAVFFVEGSNLDNNPPGILMLPPMAGTMFENVRGASGHVGSPPAPAVVVAELQRAQRAVPTGPGQFDWTTIRADTDVDWPVQIFAHVDDDPYIDVIAFDPNGAGGASFCVLDVEAGAQIGCYASVFGMNTARMVTGSVAGPDQLDVVLTDARPPGNPETNVFVLGNLRINGGDVLADVASTPYEAALPDAMPAVLQLDSGPAEMVVMGSNGGVECLRPGSGNSPPVRCAP